MVQQPDWCSNTKSLKLSRNINRPLGTPVSKGGEAKSKRYVLRHLLKVATKVAERIGSGRLFQREGVQELKALAPVSVLILGTDRVIPLFDLSECDGIEGASKTNQTNLSESKSIITKRRFG